MARMTPVAVIRNPRSSRNARSGAAKRVVATALEIPVAEPETPLALTAALRRFRAEGVELLGIDGGDGTVRDVVTALIALGWSPRLAIMPSGRINLIAGDVGLRRGGEAGLREIAALARGVDHARTERRPLLRLDRAGAAPVYGMFAGAAAFAEACRLTNAYIHPRGLGGDAAIAAAIVMALGRTAAGKTTPGEPMTVAIDDQPSVNGRHFLLLATTLERLPLGLWPFWSEGTGGMHLLDVAAPPKALPRALLPLMVGWKRDWMPDAGYRSRDVQAVDLSLSAPVVLDGEEFTPGADGRIRLSTGPVMEFAHP